MAAAVDRRPIRFTRSPIYKALLSGNLEALHSAVHHAHRGDELVNLRDEQTKFSYLHLVVVVAERATEESLVPHVYALTNAGIQLDSCDCRDRTPMHIAIIKHLTSMLTALMRAGSDQTNCNYRALIARQPEPARHRLFETFDKFSPSLWSAVAGGDLGIVYILLNSWCRVRVVRQLAGNTTEGLIDWARSVGASGDMLRLLEGYEMTIEFVHAVLAGDRGRMLQLLMDSRPCDIDIMDISYQDDWTSPLRPRSLRETAEALGHQHVLDILHSESTDRRRSSSRPQEMRDSLQRTAVRLDLGFLADEDDVNAASPLCRSMPQYQSLRDSQRKRPSSAGRSSSRAEARLNIDHIATPRGGPQTAANGPTSAIPTPKPRTTKHGGMSNGRPVKDQSDINAAVPVDRPSDTARKEKDGDDDTLVGEEDLARTASSTARRSSRAKKFHFGRPRKGKNHHSTLCVIS